MAKRKHANVVSEPSASTTIPNKKSKLSSASQRSSKGSTTETIQIVVGSYDRILHGITATLEPRSEKAEFADTFLFGAHTAAIKCLAVSPISAPIPGQTQKVLLASGSSDERINVYSLSAHPSSQKTEDALAKVAPRPILENRGHRELGTLWHHSSSITALRFPTRSKLLSSGEDSTVAVTRTRDWSTLSTIKAPQPKAQGRPSGDTAPFGGTPSGINDFAIHPSMKLMISVSKGERCMRLWNLVTGKKAGVLNFDKDMLQEAGEGKFSTGEGRLVVWGIADGADEFAVGFDRDILVFGMDSVPKCRVMGAAKTKIHKFEYVTISDEESLLAVATEDGRILFFSTKSEDVSASSATNDKKSIISLPTAKPVAFVGGKDEGVSGRIKDFGIVKSNTNDRILYVVGGSSDGKVRLWRVGFDDMERAAEAKIGALLGTYDTQNRVTCMVAYMMIPRPEGVEDSEDDLAEVDDSEDDDSEDDEGDDSEGSE